MGAGLTSTEEEERGQRVLQQSGNGSLSQVGVTETGEGRCLRTAGDVPPTAAVNFCSDRVRLSGGGRLFPFSSSVSKFHRDKSHVLQCRTDPSGF